MNAMIPALYTGLAFHAQRGEDSLATMNITNTATNLCIEKEILEALELVAPQAKSPLLNSQLTICRNLLTSAMGEK